MSRKVKDVMTTNVAYVSKDTPYKELGQLLAGVVLQRRNGELGARRPGVGTGGLVGGDEPSHDVVR